MGMDLVPRTKVRVVESFHANWSGWSQLGNVLEGLGCDLSEMSGCNDGDVISAKTCKAWAKELAKALDEGSIKTVYTKDEFYLGGGYNKLTVSNGYTGEKDLIESDRDWLESFVEFLYSCGGCRQC